MPAIEYGYIARTEFGLGDHVEVATSSNQQDVALDELAKYRVPGGTTETRCFVDQAGDVRIIPQSSGMWQYLEREAARRRISVVEMYDIEEEAGREIERLGITDDFLDYVTRVSWPQQRIDAQQK